MLWHCVDNSSMLIQYYNTITDSSMTTVVIAGCSNCDVRGIKHGALDRTRKDDSSSASTQTSDCSAFIAQPPRRRCRAWSSRRKKWAGLAPRKWYQRDHSAFRGCFHFTRASANCWFCSPRRPAVGGTLTLAVSNKSSEEWFIDYWGYASEMTHCLITYYVKLCEWPDLLRANQISQSSKLTQFAHENNAGNVVVHTSALNLQ